MGMIYYVLLLFLIVIFITVSLVPVISNILVYQQNYQEKISQYECGFEPFQKDLAQFEVRYYLLAILFLIFDLEIAFLLPYLIAFSNLACFGALSMVIFFFFLLLGFYYE
jgi:NADH-quinone oxidoreductase subunit A